MKVVNPFEDIPVNVLEIQGNPPKPMVSFHGSQAVKDFYLERLRWHHEQDEIIKGVYWEDGKGCAVGCSVHSDNHCDYERELGLPEWLARLEDTLFEGLPNEKAKDFPLKFIEVIPVGVVLEPVKWSFCSFLMEENLNRVEALSIQDDLKTKVRAAIEQVKSLHDRAKQTGSWDKSAAKSAESAARSAAWSARSAAESTESVGSAESVAWSAAESAWSAAVSAESTARSAESTESTAWSTAWSTAESAWSAGSAAVSAAYVKYADKLLELLSQAK